VWVNGSPNFDKIRFYPFTERLYWLTKSPKTKMFNTISHHDVFDRTEWKAMGTKGSFTRAFPPKMVEDLLSCFPDSKMVLDPFAGSGTVLEVAERMGKDSIGIELEPEHCKMIESRLNSRE
jgi:DNA modification methylase